MKKKGPLNEIKALKVMQILDSSTLAFSLSSHRPSFISLLFSSRFLDS
jgi:hypothetical protein